MDAFDQRVRDAVRHSFAQYDVPQSPAFRLAAIAPPATTARRWLVVATAAVLVVVVATAGRSAFGQIVNAVERAVEYFAVNARGQIEPVQSQSLSLAEALQLQEFQVVPPAGLPPGAALSSIERIGAGPSTMLVFTYALGGMTFTIVETPANAQGIPTVGYSVQRGSAMPPAGSSVPMSHQNFHYEATVWVSGNARISLFAENALSSDQARSIEDAMSRG